MGDSVRPCTACRRWKPLNAENFQRMTHKRSNGETVKVWSTRCRTCLNAVTAARRWRGTESETAAAVRKARLRARQRAKNELARIYPRLYEELVTRELAREGVLNVDLRLGTKKETG